MQAFLLDPQGLGSVSIESEYVDLAEHQDAACWIELPLEQLKKTYSSPAEQAFLQNSIVAKQPGRPHPQAPEDENMRLYWVYKESTETDKNLKRIGSRVTAAGTLPTNRAAGQAVADGLTNFAAGFGKGSSAALTPAAAGKGNKGKGKDPTPKEPKAKKARCVL